METERLILRRFMLNDANECFDTFGQDDSIGKYIAGYPMRSLDEMKNMIAEFCNNENIWLIEEKKSKLPIGYITIDIPYEMLGIGELGFIIGKSFQHKGYAVEAVTHILKYLFDEKSMYMIEAKVNEYNISSEKLLKKLGFKKDGVLRNRRINLSNGERCDVVVYSITNEEWVSIKNLQIEGKYVIR